MSIVLSNTQRTKKPDVFDVLIGLTLGATDVLVVDLNAKQATFNGAVRPADLFSAWWVMPQQTTTTVQVTGTGGTGSQMTVTWRDAWI